MDIHPKGAGQLPCRLPEQLVLTPRTRTWDGSVDVRVSDNGLKDLGRWHARLLAPPAARIREEPLQHERERPARKGEMAAMGSRRRRQLGKPDRSVLFECHRTDLRVGALRRAGADSRVGGAAAGEAVLQPAAGGGLPHRAAIHAFSQTPSNSRAILANRLDHAGDDAAGTEEAGTSTGFVRGGDYYGKAVNR